MRAKKNYRLSLLTLVALIIVSLACGNSSATKAPRLETITPPKASQVVEPTNTLEITSIPKPTETLGLPTSTEALQATGTLALQPTSTPTQEPAPGSPQPLRAHYIDVGQGDAILIIAPDGQTMLIDGGETVRGRIDWWEMASSG